jgi:hypothetical protein
MANMSGRKMLEIQPQINIGFVQQVGFDSL